MNAFTEENERPAVWCRYPEIMGISIYANFIKRIANMKKLAILALILFCAGGCSKSNNPNPVSTIVEGTSSDVAGIYVEPSSATMSRYDFTVDSNTIEKMFTVAIYAIVNGDTFNTDCGGSHYVTQNYNSSWSYYYGTAPKGSQIFGKRLYFKYVHADSSYVNSLHDTVKTKTEHVTYDSSFTATVTATDGMIFQY